MFQFHGSRKSANSIMIVCVSLSYKPFLSFTNTDLRKGNLQEEYFLDTSEVLDDTSAVQEHSPTQRPGRCGQKHPKDRRNDPNLWQLPLNGGASKWGVIIRNGNGTQVGKECDENDEFRTDGLVKYDHGQRQVDLKMQAKCDTVHNVRCRRGILYIRTMGVSIGITPYLSCGERSALRPLWQ